MTRDTPRQTRTPAQRAQDAIDVLERRIARLTEKRDAAHAEAQTYAADISANESRLAYARQHPDLPTTTPTGAAR